MSALPDALPAIHSAKLPDSYERAKQALSACSSLDECKEWSDRAVALASYARQAQDESLEALSRRIRMRACRRQAELLRMLDGRDGRNLLPEAPGEAGAKPDPGDLFRPITRTEAARSAGISERQQKQAMRIGRIPEKVFEELVESEKPPTIAQAAELGKKSRQAEPAPAKPEPMTPGEQALSRPKPPFFAEATQAMGHLREFAEMCSGNRPEQIVQGIEPFEVQDVRNHIATIDQWLDRLVVNLKGA